MPVENGIFTPHGELTLAETVVDFASMNQMVIDQRARVERKVLPTVRTLAATAVTFEILPREKVEQLAGEIEAALDTTLVYGYQSARRELRQLRKEAPVEARYVIPDAGRYARTAAEGLVGIRKLIRRRARQAAEAITQRALAVASVAVDDDKDETDSLIAVIAAATATLHNHVIELVGETLNLGRTAGVLELDKPPTFAMRSEQLDKAMCSMCGSLHGAIVEFGSSSYFDYMPPAGCFGGGRCRGVYVHADGVDQVRGPDVAPGPQPELPAIPPVQFPKRRAA